MWMKLELSRPDVQHHRDPKRRPKPAVSEVEQRLARRLYESRENITRKHLRETTQLARKCKDHVKVFGWQQPLRARTNPFLLLQGLALRAVPVTAGVVGGMLVAAADAHVEVAPSAAVRQRSIAESTRR